MTKRVARRSVLSFPRNASKIRNRGDIAAENPSFPSVSDLKAVSAVAPTNFNQSRLLLPSLIKMLIIYSIRFVVILTLPMNHLIDLSTVIERRPHSPSSLASTPFTARAQPLSLRSRVAALMPGLKRCSSRQLSANFAGSG